MYVSSLGKCKKKFKHTSGFVLETSRMYVFLWNQTAAWTIRKRMQRRKTDERQHAKRRSLQNSDADLQNVGSGRNFGQRDTALWNSHSYTVCGEWKAGSAMGRGICTATWEWRRTLEILWKEDKESMQAGAELAALSFLQGNYHFLISYLSL